MGHLKGRGRAFGVTRSSPLPKFPTPVAVPLLPFAACAWALAETGGALDDGPQGPTAEVVLTTLLAFGAHTPSFVDVLSRGPCRALLRGEAGCVHTPDALRGVVRQVRGKHTALTILSPPPPSTTLPL
jgi:hypothetical protein